MTRADLLSQVQIDDKGCWVWLGSVNGAGYGQHGQKRTGVHRIAYELWNGPIPRGVQVDHKCRVRCCVNPEHLRLLSPSANTRVAFNANNGQMAKKALRQMRWLHARVCE